MKILVTGGLGYIGSHTCVALLDAGHDVAIIDNLSNSTKMVLKLIEQITKRKPVFFEGDIRDNLLLQTVFTDFQAEAVIHFAGLKSVSESICQPERYYNNNVVGTLELLKNMQCAGVKTLVFSSTANVYGNSDAMPVTERAIAAPNNPYGRSKLMIEEILRDFTSADPAWRVACLRYFNPVGAHSSGSIGENPLDVPSNLMPIITQVARGERAKLSIFGQDYATPDGTGVRDFIHVMDLAESHLAALRYLSTSDSSANKYLLVNVGTGNPISVLEMVLAFEHHTGVPIPYEFFPRRAGDIAVSYADASLAERTMGWKARFGLEDMCKDTWRYQLMNLKSHQK